MSARPNGTRQSERGAVIIQVAIILLGLLAFSAFAIDYGVMWVSRRQAQNAADAGALAGAISLAYTSPDHEIAKQAAAAAAAANPIWGVTPNVGVTGGQPDVIIGPCPVGAPGIADTCVRVNVYRNQQKNPLPTVFARLVGVTDQGVRATATAQVLFGNTTQCLKPWAIPDKWFDNLDTDPPIDAIWTPDDVWERYDIRGAGVPTLLPEPRDVYVPPSDGNAGSGFRLPEDLGRQVYLKQGNPHQALNAGWFFPIDLPLQGEPLTGGDRYRENIANCNSMPVTIGMSLWNEPGNMVGPTDQGVRDLIAKDPGAYWDAGTNTIQNSCVNDTPPCAALSPRVVAVPVFDVDAYTLQDKTSGKFQITITNILGFFIQGMDGNNVVGYFVRMPGQFSSSRPALNSSSSFLRDVILVR